MSGHLPDHGFESLPESLSFFPFFFFVCISHLSISMTLTRLRSDCQVWSMFTTEPALLHAHCTPPHTHTHANTHAQCVHTFPVLNLQCLSPLVLSETNYVPLSPYGVTSNTKQFCMHSYMSLYITFISSHQSYDDKHGSLCSPMNTLFTQPCSTIMKRLPSNL